MHWLLKTTVDGEAKPWSPHLPRLPSLRFSPFLLSPIPLSHPFLFPYPSPPHSPWQLLGEAECCSVPLWVWQRQAAKELLVHFELKKLHCTAPEFCGRVFVITWSNQWEVVWGKNSVGTWSMFITRLLLTVSAAHVTCNQSQIYVTLTIGIKKTIELCNMYL